jgi:hypothetical protein
MAVLVVAVLLIAAWVSTDWDMRSVERRARTAQLAWTQGELSKTSYAPADLELLRRADVAQHAIGRVEEKAHVPYRQVVQSALEQHAAELSTIEGAVDQLSGQPIALDWEELRAQDIEPGVTENVAWCLGQRIRFCDATELDNRIVRLAHFIPCVWPTSRRDHCLETLLRQMAYRADDLRGDKRAISALAGALDLVAANIGDDFERQLARDADALANAWHPDSWYSSTHTTLIRLDRFSLGRKFMARLERADYLDQLVTISDVLAHHDRSEWPLLLPLSQENNRWEMLSQWKSNTEAWAWWPCSHQITGKVLLSYLRGEPLPGDPFRPGSTFKPILRNGVMIGAYGVGHDGRDDGGDVFTDFCVVLGPHSLGHPLASNPMPDPSY